MKNKKIYKNIFLLILLIIFLILIYFKYIKIYYIDDLIEFNKNFTKIIITKRENFNGDNIPLKEITDIDEVNSLFKKINSCKLRESFIKAPEDLQCYLLSFYNNKDKIFTIIIIDEKYIHMKIKYNYYKTFKIIK